MSHCVTLTFHGCTCPHKFQLKNSASIPCLPFPNVPPADRCSSPTSSSCNIVNCILLTYTGDVVSWDVKIGRRFGQTYGLHLPHTTIILSGRCSKDGGSRFLRNVTKPVPAHNTSHINHIERSDNLKCRLSLSPQITAVTNSA